MAGRPKGAKASKPVMGEEHRAKIRNSSILNSLIAHVEGEKDMTATQVTAGLALLKKVFPDMQPIDPETGKGGVTLYIDKHVAKL